MQQNVLLIRKLYIFCIYSSLNNFKYPPKKIGNPIKINKTLPQKFLGNDVKHLREKIKLVLVLDSASETFHPFYAIMTDKRADKRQRGS